MKISAYVTIPENEYMRLLHIAHIQMAHDPKFSGLIINLGQNEEYQFKLSRKQLIRDIRHLQFDSKDDPKSFWNLPKEKLLLFPSQ
jgi:hypothetical protein